ncbi:hypothetical protein E5676_scaffold458G00100 [Cucumis melo var. makuwa]|uniref:Gag protease polyprotein n=1 Tax=Cucumis melo var. makuwa TaxID=1194695 RepID=A0A5D3CEF7_CUCMM|nr:hypothetical protein E5676_scaffold458G00100 [Cucumis melo var. makuwa]
MIRVIQQDHSQLDCLSVSSRYSTDQFVLGVPTGSHVARVRERAGVEEKMSSRRGARRGGGRRGRGAGRIQPEEQPAVQAANPTALVTQTDLAAMEQ